MQVTKKLRGLAVLVLCTWVAFGADLPRITPLPEAQSRSGSSLQTREMPLGNAMSLTLTDAVAFAIANNLDVEVARYAIRIARTDIDRARGGGIVRTAGAQVFETPAGVGGPGAPLLNESNTIRSSSSIANALAPIDLLESRQTSTSISAASD